MLFRSYTNTEAGTLNSFTVLDQISDQLCTTTDLKSLLDVSVGVVKNLTQFHRILAYRFDEDWNAEVVAELIDRERSSDVQKGLVFPASMISPQVILSVHLRSTLFFHYIDALFLGSKTL